MSRPRGIELSGSKVIAAVMATLTGAIAASYLGVAGTLIGAALGSLASTMGTEVYRHYLLRSQEKLKAAGVLVQHRAAGRSATGQQEVARTRELARRSAGSYQGAGAADAEETQVIPSLAGAWRGGPPSEAGPAAGHQAAGDVSGGAGSARPGGTGHWWSGISRRQWLAYGAVAAGIFLVVMAGITIVELSVGKPLEAAVWGRHATGTSVGNLVSGRTPGQHGVTHTPASRSAQPSTSASPGASGSSAAPTAGSSSPPGASSSPSAVPTTAAPTTGGPGSTGPTTGTQSSGTQNSSATPAP